MLRDGKPEGFFYLDHRTVDKKHNIITDIYVCPNKYFLKYKTTTRQGYKEYTCDKEYCSSCKHNNLCLTGKTEFRTIRRHV